MELFMLLAYGTKMKVMLRVGILKYYHFNIERKIIMEKIFDEIVDGKRVIKLKMTEAEIEAAKKRKAEMKAKQEQRKAEMKAKRK
jgi:hypothetical protein